MQMCQSKHCFRPSRQEWNRSERIDISKIHFRPISVPKPRTHTWSKFWIFVDVAKCFASIEVDDNFYLRTRHLMQNFRSTLMSAVASLTKNKEAVFDGNTSFAWRYVYYNMRRAGARTLIGGGIYSYIQVLPTSFFCNKFDFFLPEYMNMHPPN